MSLGVSVLRLLYCLLVAALGWAAAPAVWAQATTGPSKPVATPVPTKAETSGPAWLKLTPQQRQALAPLERDWPALDSSRKSKWLEVAARFSTMPPDEQHRTQTRMAEWARLTPAERGQARLSFQESKQLSREEKQQRWEAYQALPADQRQALAERARPVDDRAKPSAGGTGPLNAASSKVNIAPVAGAASGPLGKAVSPTVVQAKPGATTTLMTKAAAPPAHQHPGQPKIAAQPGQVNPATLLPQSGPQAAASAPRLP